MLPAQPPSDSAYEKSFSVALLQLSLVGLNNYLLVSSKEAPHSQADLGSSPDLTICLLCGLKGDL